MTYIENQLTYEDYCALRTSVEWLNFSKEQARRALNHSIYTITVQEELPTDASGERSTVALGAPRTIAMGRLVGDGLYCLIVDVVVHPENIRAVA